MLNISQCSTTGWKEKNYTGQYELKSFKDEQKYATFWQIKKRPSCGFTLETHVAPP